MSDDDFSNYPRSVAEVRSDKTMRADQWSVRDALIAALRDLDSGKISPDAVIVAWGKVGDGDITINWYLASPNPFMSLGLMDRVKHRLNDAMSAEG